MGDSGEIYFKDSRLELSGSGAFFVRFAVNVAYLVYVFGTMVLLFSDVGRLRALGALLALFLIDRLFHVGEAEKTLSDVETGKINIASLLTPRAFRLMERAFRRSLATGEHFHFLLLYYLLDDRDVREALVRLDVDEKEFIKRNDAQREQFQSGAGIPWDVQKKRLETHKFIEQLMYAAYRSAQSTREKFIEPRNFLVALCDAGIPELTKFFESFNISSLDAQESIIFGRFRRNFSGIRRIPAVLGGFAHRPRFLRHRVMNRSWTARPTPTLDAFSSDLTDLARSEKVGFLIGHEKEFKEMLRVISRPGKPNALLIGEPGSGKSTMIAHLAFRMVKDKVPQILFDKRLVSLEVGSIVANVSPELLAGRLQKIVEEILLAGNIVLFVPGIHDLFRTAEAKSLNAIDLLLPLIKSEAIPLIGETYPREFKKFIEPRSDFLDQFETVRVDEISPEEAIRFLIYSSILLEKEFGVVATFRSLKRAVEIAHRYFRNKLLPGSALDLLKQSLAEAHDRKLRVLNEDIVIGVAEQQSKIPIQGADVSETEKLLNLEKLIHEKLINQDAAVVAVSRALREYRSGLSRREGPIATFLFVGPTGVGKTELAKILAMIQFGSKETMYRFDMSEYQDKQSIFRFIGTPDGERTGALTDAVLAMPYSLILLDEFEKAHPDILNLFLQVFDDGRLTDGLNRTVNFENTIIIATSNAHSEFIKTAIEEGRSSEDIAQELKKKLTDYFKPELVNRFSDVMVFRNLHMDEIVRIAELLVHDLAKTLHEAHGMELTVSPEAIQKLSELGYNPVFGARPLRQVISDKIKSALAEKILRKEAVRGNEIRVTFRDETFQFIIM